MIYKQDVHYAIETRNGKRFIGVYDNGHFCQNDRRSVRYWVLDSDVVRAVEIDGDLIFALAELALACKPLILKYSSMKI